MNEELVIEIMQRTLFVTGKMAAPLLICIILVGLSTQVIQTVTQLKDQALTFIPKMVITTILMVLLIPWYIDIIRDYFHYIFELVVQARQ